MAIADLIQELQNLKHASREVDVKIGLLVGWQRRVEYTQENGEASRNVIWFLHGEKTARLPRFTETIDSALQLVDLVAPRSTGGVSWSDETDGHCGTAVINGGPYCRAATPALALCIAALKIREAEEED
ncbi:hypothetical protein PYH37_000420 [Sinorhizobium numidicum]|uniref:Phage ABA sandwich domain-containing protein n=1 Tax=Sinorhizobium numidicum TaxID=680248 RepID=A0ABY8CR05_9HYPH|nr:hypothetical protein [Sinorhizobium numidicum]WEX75086.1 hypothetical protein PYH37_000420 [Sinorhizobium numidicum]WEX81080.1 hypothetical protein PYH38_000422 [Sinorhizobium numidicum]